MVDLRRKDLSFIIWSTFLRILFAGVVVGFGVRPIGPTHILSRYGWGGGCEGCVVSMVDEPDLPEVISLWLPPDIIKVLCSTQQSLFLPAPGWKACATQKLGLYDGPLHRFPGISRTIGRPAEFVVSTPHLFG